MRLIDADALKRELDKNYIGLMFDDLYKVESFINDAPTIDAAPAVRGKWVERLWRSEDDPEYDRISTHCSRCNQQRVDGIHLANYCPNCGACMKEV